ncbi:NUDIX hydrolase [Aestuariimicrobium ganziense]|uniref:NUDIX hydrolase n=1 Tax=Aestuariimicrobium ganziense TaxID=2773677 RepID=UPI0019422D06|nr:NUDIX domain-containing protein [Aestuariimicrobium ganziense]
MGWDELHAAAIDELRQWQAPDEPQAVLRNDFLSHLATHPDGHRKAGPPAHLTASCVVLEPTGRRVLLTHHLKAQVWLQFGGHLELDDRSLADGALREAREESGVDDLELLGGVLELDRHDLIGDFGHCGTHLDVRFVAIAQPDVEHAVSAESIDVAWFDVDELPNPVLVPVVGRAVARLRASGTV